MVINAPPNSINYNNGASPQNVQIIQNGAAPSSNEENYVQKFEKPKGIFLLSLS